MKTTIKRFFTCLLLVALTVGMPIEAQTGKWREMYQVKKKDTLYRIAKNYGITLEELIEANPDMKMEGYELKRGDYIFIPYAKTEVKPQAAATPTKSAANDVTAASG